MKSITTENRNELLNEIDAFASRGGISRDKAVAAWYAAVILNIDEDDAIDAASVDGPEDQGCDFVYVDDEQEAIYVLQGYIASRSDKGAPKKKWDALTAVIANIKNPESFKDAGRDDIYERLIEIKDANLSYDIVLGLVSLAEKTDQIDRSCETSNKNSTYDGCRFFYEHQDSLWDKWLVVKSVNRNVDEDTLTFIGDVARIKGDFGEAVIGTVPASELVRLYSSHENQLFEGNVRLFVGQRKGGINEKIIETARERPGVFWALNNGITIVAETAESVGESKIKMRRFSIVNGCQTTVSLSRSGNVDNASVLVRVVSAKKPLITDIVRYNNTQNPVKLSAVRSLDPIQNDLREQFKKINIAYAPKQEGARATRGSTVIELERIAQYIACTEETTILDAVSKKKELFDRHYNSIFTRQLRPERVFLIWLLANEVETARTRVLETSDHEDLVIKAILGINGTPWGVFVAWNLIDSVGVDLTKFSLAKMNSEEFVNAIKKYAEKAVDLYAELASVALGGVDGNPRNEIRTKPFLDQIKRLFSLRRKNISAMRLPKLNAVLSSIK